MEKVDGHTIKNQIKKSLQQQINEQDEMVRLDLFYVGNDPTIETFMQLKKQFGEDIGVQVVGHTFSADVKKGKLQKSLQTVAQSSAVDGMVIQLPIPDSFPDTLTDAIPLQKDVDVLSTEMKKRFAHNESPILPPVVGVIKEICDRYGITLSDKSIAIVGNGKLVGRPTALWLDNQSTQYDLYEKGDDLTQLKTADIIISGAGEPHIITPDILTTGVILFDAGTSQSDGGVRGDIHPDSYQKAKLVTPVPGGIGPITIAKLFQNLLTLQNRQ
jgi:methylenetetrahydrofolate dehydrogenase (NADP+)/methenyltetrahydrofolate cyclohydrolase